MKNVVRCMNSVQVDQKLSHRLAIVGLTSFGGRISFVTEEVTTLVLREI